MHGVMPVEALYCNEMKEVSQVAMTGNRKWIIRVQNKREEACKKAKKIT